MRPRISRYPTCEFPMPGCRGLAAYASGQANPYPIHCDKQNLGSGLGAAGCGCVCVCFFLCLSACLPAWLSVCLSVSVCVCDGLEDIEGVGQGFLIGWANVVVWGSVLLAHSISVYLSLRGLSDWTWCDVHGQQTSSSPSSIITTITTTTIITSPSPSPSSSSYSSQSPANPSSWPPSYRALAQAGHHR